MARGARKKTPSKPKAGVRPTTPASPPLRGGVGNAPAGENPFANIMAAEDAALDPEMARLAVTRPTVLQGTTKRMSVKRGDSLQQIADSTVAAAYNHRASPDSGTDLYARAFQALDDAARSRLLGAMDAADADLVVRVLGGEKVVAAAPQGGAAPQTRQASAEGRAKARARQALEQAGLQDAPQLQSADRLTPTSFEQLSPDAQRAVARGNELQDAVEEFERWNPDFLDTPKGQRLADEMFALLETHPEAEAFIADPGLMARQMPPLQDAVLPEAGRAALPDDMRLTSRIGGEARAEMKLATQPERRLGRYKDIPADAPNRMAWVLIKDAEEATKEGVTLDTYRRMKGTKRLTDEDRAAQAAGRTPRKKFAERVEVYLPPTEEIAQRANRARGGAQADIDAGSSGGPRQRRVEPQQPELSAERIAELDAAAEQARQRIATAENAGPAKPVEDLTTDPDFYKTQRQVDARPLPGSATGSPSQVRFDRDFALREGKSDIDKWREKIFRLANETVDPEKVGVGSRGLMIGDRSGAGSSVVGGDLGDDLRASAVSEQLGGDEAIRTRAGKGKGPRDSRRSATLPLDFLVPQWRGYIQARDGGVIVARRPNAYEVAGFILDQLDLPDAGMASRLEAHVQQAMDALEAQAPTRARARQAAGTVFQPNNAYRRIMESEAYEARSPGDNRPLYDEQSALAAEEAAAKARMTLSEEAKFLPAPDAEAPVTPDNQQFMLQEDASSGGDVADGGAGNPPTMGEAESAFSRMRKGGKSGGSPTNIAGLLALTTAGLAGGSAMAGEGGGELPPVEYLAMARSPRRVASKGARAAQQAAQGGTAGAAAGAGKAGSPPPNLPPRNRNPRPAPAQQPAPAPAPAPAPQTTGQTPPSGPAPATDTPRPPMFPDSPTARAVGPIMGFAGRHIPDIGALIAAGTAAPYLIGLARRGINYMTAPLGREDPASDPKAELDELFGQGILAPAAQPMPQRLPAPAAPGMNQGSSNSIDVLRSMLNQRRMV